MNTFRSLSKLFCWALGILISLLWIEAGEARVGDGTLWLRWTHAPADAGSFVLLEPAGGSQSLSLPVQGGSSPGSGDFRFLPIPAGAARLELRSPAGELMAAWSVSLAAELTTKVELDLEGGRFLTDPAHPDPFGNGEIWDRGELRALPGRGAEGALWLNTTGRPAAQALLDGACFPTSARLSEKSYPFEGDVVSVQVPLGASSAALDVSRPSILTRRIGSTSAALFYQQGIGNRPLGQIDLGVNQHLGPLGPIEARVLFQAERQEDAGPLGIASQELPNNKLEGMSTRAVLYARPAGFGLACLDFYARGEKRHYSLHEFARDSEHTPRQDVADLRALAAYDLPVGRSRLSLEAGYDRSFLETGDGRYFDNLDLYRVGKSAHDNEFSSKDSLYWRGRVAGSSTVPHLYNYYLRDLTSAWRVRAEAVHPFSSTAPLRLGVELRRMAYRTYELFNPIEQTRGDLVYFGYTTDGKEHLDEGAHEARKPDWLTLFASQRLRLGALDLEGGIRTEQFRSGQRPLADFSQPFVSANDTLLTLASKDPSHWEVEPRIGLHWQSGANHLWADGGITHQDPPLEALYYSANVIANTIELLRTNSLPGRSQLYISGNPDLQPEVTRSAQLGYARSLSSTLFLRASARLARTEDTWVAAPYTQGYGDLNFYQNQGNRRQRGAHLSLLYTPSPRTRFRVLYDLSRLETNVIEPAPLYRALLRSGTPAEGTGVRETSPLAFDWLQREPAGDYFPSLFDRTHRLSLAMVTELGTSQTEESITSLMQNATLAATFRAASGSPYTPTEIKAEGLMLYGPQEQREGALIRSRRLAGAGVNSERMPWSWQCDLALHKPFRLLGGTFGFQLEALNITGRKNVRAVYGATGEPDADGWAGGLTQEYRDRLDNPLNYEEGRSFRAALSYRY